MKKLIIVGAGGYAKSVIDSVDRDKYLIHGFIDEFSNKESHLGYPIIAKSITSVPDYKDYVYFIAIGNNKIRKKWFDRLIKLDVEIINVIDKSAIISSLSKIGTGCFVGKMAIVNAGVEIGDNCIINTKALVEHGCHIKNHVNVSTNTVLNGDVTVYDGSFIGSCSVIIGQLTVGEWSIVGAAAAVIRNVDSNITVAGVPAKKIRDGAVMK